MFARFTGFASSFTVLILAVACGSSGSGGSGNPSSNGGSTSASPGNEGGPCYPNSTCNAGLTCASNLCVRLGGGTGGSPGVGGIMGNGGVPIGSGGVGPTGGLPGSGGIVGAGGIPPGTGGQVGGTGGAATCTDTTSDPKNCGTCGHACRSQDTGACVNGQCAPSLGDCFQQSAFSTCDAYCASINETCASSSCMAAGALSTWLEWTDRSLCRLATTPLRRSGAATCSNDLSASDPGNPTALYRCCCTDTK